MPANTTATNANRLTRRLLLAGTALLAIAGTALALPLPIGVDQSISTPAGSYSAYTDGDAASACISPSTPSLPAVPAVPLPLPVALPAIDAPSGAATVCADASPDGVSADASADAAGMHAGTGADVDTSQQHESAKGAAEAVSGFFGSLAKALKFW